MGVYGFFLYTQSVYKGSIFTENTIEPGRYPIAIVFGAGVWHGNEPSPVLYDRLSAAANLYKSGRVRKLLLTGDNRFIHYNEPEVMRKTAIKLGVPDKDLVLDYAGRRSYDSCYRAAHIFNIQNAVLVSQRFHLPRALYLSKAFGIEAVGLAADFQRYPWSSRSAWYIREILATLGAWLNLSLWHPKPILGDKLPIEF